MAASGSSGLSPRLARFMSLPGGITATAVTGTYTTATGSPLNGSITFQPSTELTDAALGVDIPPYPLTYQLANGAFTTAPLVDDSNTGLGPAGWAYQVTLEITGVPDPMIWFVQVPHSSSPVDISTLSPVVPGGGFTGYLPLVGGALSGSLTLTGTPPLVIPASAGAGKVLTSDGSGHGAWQAAGAGVTLDTTSGDIAALGTQAAGGTGKAADAGHVHPLTGVATAAALTAETARATSAEALLAPKASPALTGSPTAPTQSALDNSAKIATTAYADAAVAAGGGGGGGGLPTTGGTMTGPIAMSGNKVTGLGNGTASGDAAAFGQVPVLNGTAGTVSASAVGDAKAAGSATTAAKADHAHGREAFGAVTAQTSFGASSANGTAVTVSHSDHVHGTPAAATTATTQGPLDNSTSIATTAYADAADAASLTAAKTLTNKRITKRVLALSAGSATPAINTDLYDVVHITGQGSTAITSFTSGLTGTPADGDTLRISVTGSGAVALTWGASFEASGTVALPATTVAAARLDVGFFWNSESSKWRCVGAA